MCCDEWLAGLGLLVLGQWGDAWFEAYIPLLATLAKLALSVKERPSASLVVRASAEDGMQERLWRSSAESVCD